MVDVQNTQQNDPREEIYGLIWVASLKAGAWTQVLPEGGLLAFLGLHIPLWRMDTVEGDSVSKELPKLSRFQRTKRLMCFS